MMLSEATDLTERITGIWSAPPPEEWIEVLEPLDRGSCGTAFARLRRQHRRRWLSIGEFMEVYEAIDPYDASNRPVKCDVCGGAGWVDTERHYQALETLDGTPISYTAAQPCEACPAGEAAKASRVWRDAVARKLLFGPPPTAIDLLPPPLPEAIAEAQAEVTDRMMGETDEAEVEVARPVDPPLR